MTGIRPVPDESAASPTTRSSENQTFSELLQRAGRGDEEAFADLYDAVASRLHGLVLRVVRDPAQAEEVTQEAMVEIWRQSARFDPALGSPLSWLMTIAHRRAVDRVRSAEATSRRFSWRSPSSRASIRPRSKASVCRRHRSNRWSGSPA